MKINTPLANQGQAAEVSGSKKSEKGKGVYENSSKKPVERSESSGASAAAMPQISSRSKEMAKAKQAAAQAPDIREERVSELKRKIQNGSYQVSSEAIADKLVDQHLETMI